MERSEVWTTGGSMTPGRTRREDDGETVQGYDEYNRSGIQEMEGLQNATSLRGE